MSSTSKEYRAYDNLRRRHGFNCSFLRFIAVVGAAPSLTHTIKRLDKSIPYGITNIAWFPKIITGKDKRDHKEEIKTDILMTIDNIKRRKL